MRDEQRVSWQELLAQSRDDFEAGTDFTLALFFLTLASFFGLCVSGLWHTWSDTPNSAADHIMP